MVLGGSSPLARGLRLQLGDYHHIYGIIPARAGFTPGLVRYCCTGRDHPRSRGVYIALRAYTRPMRGSSPLARGLLAVLFNVSYAEGIIPARAGFTAVTAI